jgi:hypothetical protein
MLSHIKNSTAGRKAWEMHVDSLFRVTIMPPAGVTGSEILTEQCRSCTGWKQPGPENVAQKFMQASRNYASTDSDNTQEIEMSFELNLNDTFQNYVYNTISEWRSKVFNPLTGERGLKKDYIGTVIVESFAADGTIYWTRTLHNVWPKGDQSSLGQNDYDTADPVKLTQAFVADWYDEVKY